MRRTLSLKRETLAELSAAELSSVVGGADFTRVGTTCPLRECLTIGTDSFANC